MDIREKDIDTLQSEAHHNFDSLVSIMHLLRSENGCPWDREQDHKSIRVNFIEETYEVIEAIDTNDASLLREELGDVLLQVIFHARIAEEEGQFDIEDVVHDISAKLIHRHPHIFSDTKANTTDEVLSNWENIKKEEKNRVGLYGTLSSIPPSLPALMRSQKICKKAEKEGFIPSSSESADNLLKAATRIAANAKEGNSMSLREDLGCLLMAASYIAQQNHLDTEKILYDRCAAVTDTVAEVEAKFGSVQDLQDDDAEKWITKTFFSE